MPSAINAVTDSSPQLENSRTGLANNYEMFLSLLTSQMKNQDPLDPLDSTQFVNQLVSFSGVEQQIAQKPKSGKPVDYPVGSGPDLFGWLYRTRGHGCDPG